MDHQDNKFITICHGCFNKKHWLFKYDNNNKPIDVKILGWNNMKYTNVIYDLKFILEKFSDNLNFNKTNDIFHDYFCTIITEYNEQSNEKLYREFLLTYYYPNIILNNKTRENEIEIIKLLDKL